MALSAYQVQFKRRMKKALALRAKSDRRARALTARLVASLADGETAAGHLERINTLYGTSVSIRTDLVAGFKAAGTAAGLGTVAAASLDGVPAVVYAPIADGNGGLALAADVALD